MIARPGPYINAETDGGGIAAWVLNAPGGYRTDARPYVSAALQWLSEIDSIIAPHQITKGGDVIAYQIENEYTGRSTADLQYLANLEQQARSDGINVPFTFNQCCGGPFYTCGTGAVNISGPDNYPLGFNCADTVQLRPAVRLPDPARRAAVPARVPGRLVRRLGRLRLRQLLHVTGPGLRERLLQEQHRPGRHHAEQLHGRGRDELGLAACPAGVHVLRLRRGHPGDRRDRHPGRPGRHHRVQVRREQAHQRLRDLGRAADQDHRGRRAHDRQPGGGRHGPGQPRQRHPVHLPAPGRRHLDRDGEHAHGAERRRLGRLHLRRHQPRADLHRRLDARGRQAPTTPVATTTRPSPGARRPATP